MNTEHVILTQHYPSPCGDLILGSYEDRLCLCNWVIEKHQGRVDKRLQNLLNADYKEGKSDIIQEAARQLDEYFKRADNVRYSHTIYRYRFPEKSMAQIIGNPLWTNSFLW